MSAAFNVRRSRRNSIGFLSNARIPIDLTLSSSSASHSLLVTTIGTWGIRIRRAARKSNPASTEPFNRISVTTASTHERLAYLMASFVVRHEVIR